ncbi:hypothetical protein J6590_019297, partial [Homalodisca vitripennis]
MYGLFFRLYRGPSSVSLSAAVFVELVFHRQQFTFADISDISKDVILGREIGENGFNDCASQKSCNLILQPV